MKNLFGLLFVLALFTLVSCGDDDDCTAASFAGTYSGSVDCDGTSTEGTITLSRISDTELQLTDTDGSSFTLTLDGCTATGSESFIGLADISISITLDGDDLKYTQDVSALGINVSCEGTLKK